MKKQTRKIPQICIKFNPEMLKAIEQRAHKERRTISNLVRIMVEDALSKKFQSKKNIPT